MANDEDLRLAVLDTITKTWRSAGLSEYAVSTLLEDVSFRIEHRSVLLLDLPTQKQTLLNWDRTVEHALDFAAGSAHMTVDDLKELSRKAHSDSIDDYLRSAR